MAIFSFNEYVPSVNATAWVAESAQVIGRVAIDREASIWPGAVLRGDIADIRIGAGSNVQDNAVVHVETEHPCVVGENGHDRALGGASQLHGCRRRLDRHGRRGFKRRAHRTARRRGRWSPCG